jgi:hypothetical protein
MSGQELTIPMTELISMKMNGVEEKGQRAGIWDLQKLMPGIDIGGFLSLTFFRTHPFTIDYQKHVIRFEDPASLAEIRKLGAAIPVSLEEKDSSLGVVMPLTLPNKKQIAVEVDTGSQALILNEKFMKPLGADAKSKEVKRKEGQDETGHKYTRYFTALKGSVHLSGFPEYNHERPDVMFQKIIYDGLAGHFFFKQFRVTYDLKYSEMIFRKFN